jgi:di/tricarboxylate transporter
LVVGEDMEWIKILGLILSVICFLSLILQFYLFKKEFQQLDDNQVIPEEIAKRWVKRLHWGITLIILSGILSIVAIILPYLK